MDSPDCRLSLSNGCMSIFLKKSFSHSFFTGIYILPTLFPLCSRYNGHYPCGLSLLSSVLSGKAVFPKP